MTVDFRETDTELVRKLPINRFYHDRVLEAIRSVTISPHGKHPASTVSNMKGHKDWPLKGTISFTRDADGKRFKIWMTKKGFKCE